MKNLTTEDFENTLLKFKEQLAKVRASKTNEKELVNELIEQIRASGLVASVQVIFWDEVDKEAANYVRFKCGVP